MAEYPNTQLIRDGYQAFSRGDMARLSELFTQDIQWHEAGGATVPIAGDYKGQAAVFEMFGRLVELTDGQFHVVLIECVADDHQAVAIHEVSARRGRHTYQSREAIVFHLLEGKVTDAWHTVPDIEAFDGFWAEDTAEHPHVALTRRGYQGRDAILGFFARLVDETGGQLQVELVDCMANDERTSSVTRATASRKGRTITMNETHLARLRDGRIVEFWEVPDDQPAADQFWS
jgi:ketosteroid isomerase-like protein